MSDETFTKKDLQEFRSGIDAIKRIVQRRQIYSRVTNKQDPEFASEAFLYDIELSDVPCPDEQSKPWTDCLPFGLKMPSFEKAETVLLFLALLMTFDGFDFYINNIVFDPDDMLKRAEETFE